MLLRRALDSLLAQTCTDWVCELHNDDPTDCAPAELLRNMGDSRIQLHQHTRNLGPIVTFNIAHAGATELFFAILEDDNWWEPSFLARMIDALDGSPEAQMAWANMRIWRESTEGWTDTGQTIWPHKPELRVTISWPQLLQFDTPLHSNGAMLVRSSSAERGQLQVSAITPFDVVENLRERNFRYPILLVADTLANFAVTQNTSRSRRLTTWVGVQALLGAAFLRHVALTSTEHAALWESRRTAIPPATSGLFFAAWLERTPGFFDHARLVDWFRFIRGCLRRPHAAWAALTVRRRQPELWAIINSSTAAACARGQGVADIGPKRLASRADLERIRPDRAAQGLTQ